jgi:protein-tyrosine phosphatase
MCKTYRLFATGLAASFKRFIHTIIAAEGAPVLWHCTAGKDRTGFATAVLLRILDVHQDIILSDYLLSNQYVKTNSSELVLLFLLRGPKAYRTIQPLMGTQPIWLETAFATIDEEWGDFETFTRDALELSPENIKQLRDTLLEN